MQVLLIVANGLQLGYLGCYGNEWVLTPTLDRLAAEGIVFDRHYADCPDHVRALASCRTGLYQIPLAGNEPPSPDRMHPGHDLIEILTQAGVATSLVLEKKNRAYQEFARFRQTVGPVVPEGNTEARSLDRAFASAANCLKKLAAKKNSLAWLDLTTLLPEWEFPDEYRTFYCREEAGADQEDKEKEAGAAAQEDATGEAPSNMPWTGPLPERVAMEDDITFLRLQRTFAGAVTYLDQGVESLLEELDAERLLEDLAIILTADRGLPLGEHGAAAAELPSLHEERVHLPLIIRLPKKSAGGRRVPAFTQPVDLFPTILEIFGLPVPLVHGQSLLPVCRAEKRTVRDYACSGSHAGNACAWAIRTTDWALLLSLDQSASQSSRLFVKPEDRWEMNNIQQHFPEWALHLEKTLRGFVDCTRRPGPLLPPPLIHFPAINTNDNRENATHPDTGELQP